MEDKRLTGINLELKQPDHTRALINDMMNVIVEDEHSIWHSHGEMYLFYELAKGLHDDHFLDGHIIHCGIHRGGSICAMGAGVRDSSGQVKSPVFGVDTYHNDTFFGDTNGNHKSYTISRRNIRDFNLEKHVAPIIYHDIMLFQQVSIPARLIFLDTRHFYEHIKQQIEYIVPNLLDGGWLLIHDYSSPHFTVTPAVNEFIDTQTEYDIQIYNAKLPSVMLMRLFAKTG